jgi:hypothetical protein
VFYGDTYLVPVRDTFHDSKDPTELTTGVSEAWAAYFARFSSTVLAIRGAVVVVQGFGQGLGGFWV